MHTKSKILLLFFLALACVMVLPFCRDHRKEVPAYHRFILDPDFKKLSRADMILKCSACHKQEYANEMKGPHTNAYKMLCAHKDFVNSDKYNCDFYTARVNKDFENCTGCHAPQNLFETFLKDSLDDREKLVDRIIKISHPLPPKREAAGMSRMTSVDCLNCHYDGHSIMSLKQPLSKDDSIPALQTIAVITSKNLTCFPCHADVVRTIDPAFAIRKTGSVRCVNCHVEYDASGKETHYYNWKHDPADKVNKKLFSMMDDLHFHIVPQPYAETSHVKAEIVWNNTTVPHKMSPGPEMIFICQILDKDSAVVGEKTIRINNKKAFDKEMYKAQGNHNLYGEYGDEVSLDGSPVKYAVELKSRAAPKIMRVSLIHKAQYWFPDSLGVVTAVRTYSIDH